MFFRRFLLTSLASLSLLGTTLFAENPLILYANQWAYYRPTLAQVPVINASRIDVSSLPIGIDYESLHVMAPDYHMWTYQPGLDIGKTFWDQMEGQQVRLVGKTDRPLQFLKRNQEDLYFLEKGQIVVNPEGELQLPKPQNTPLFPTLTILTPPLSSYLIDVRLAFFMSSISSDIEYRAAIQPNGDLMLSAYGILDNRSGQTLPKTRLTFSTATPKQSMGRAKAARYEMMSLSSTSGDATPISPEDYAFTLDRTVTLPQGLSKLKLFSTTSPIKARRLYRLNADSRPFNPGYVSSRLSEASMVPLSTVLQFQNTLKTPLLSGAIYLTQNQDLLGSGQLSNTPVGAEAEIDYGVSPDVQAKKQVMKQTPGTSGKLQSKQTTLEYTVENFKSTPVTVQIRDRIHDEFWEVTQSSVPHTILDASTIQFELTLSPNSRKTIELTYETKSR